MIADHSLAGNDGFNFLLGLQQAYPDIKLCVLGTRLSRSEANQLTMAGILHFEKPVLLENVCKSIKLPPPAVKKKAPQRGEGLLGLSDEAEQADPQRRKGFAKLFGRTNEEEA